MLSELSALAEQRKENDAVKDATIAAVLACFCLAVLSVQGEQHSGLEMERNPTSYVTRPLHTPQSTLHSFKPTPSSRCAYIRPPHLTRDQPPSTV